MKSEKKLKGIYFVYIYLYFLTFFEMKYSYILQASILLSLKRNNLFRKSTSRSTLQSFKINKSTLKACFKYTSEFEDKYICLESLLQVYFRFLK